MSARATLAAPGVTQHSTSSLLVSWEGVAGSVEVQGRNIDHNEWGKLGETCNQSLVKENVDPGSTYAFRVKPSEGEWAWSPISTFKAGLKRKLEQPKQPKQQSTIIVASWNIPKFDQLLRGWMSQTKMKAADCMEAFLTHHDISILAVQEFTIYQSDSDSKNERMKLWQEFSSGAEGLFTEMRRLASFYFLVAHNPYIHDSIATTVFFVRKSLFPDGFVPRNNVLKTDLPGFTEEWSNGSSWYDKFANLGRYCELEIRGITFINVYMHACMSRCPDKANLNQKYRGFFRAAIQRRIAALNGSRVCLLGDFNHTGVAQTYGTVDCLCLPDCRPTWFCTPTDRIDLRCVFAGCDHITVSRNVGIVHHIDVGHMKGCMDCCHVPCYNPAHAANASAESNWNEFPFPRTPLIIYTDPKSSDHLLVHTELTLPPLSSSSSSSC